ncbi:MAG: glycosyltransferase family 2 protein [Panacagrimonas sp.]
MIDWDSDTPAAARAIRSRRATFKILLKTRDDPYFLDRWIQHHARIVGLDNLIVFDNGSTDPAVAEILDRYAPDLLVIRFTGLHNRVHHVNRFPKLYRALITSCRYFAFLDTDEFLSLIRGHQHYSSPLIVDYLDHFPAATTFPTTWLWCVPRFADVFPLLGSPEHLANWVRWGKPILSTALPLRGFLNHNVQLPAHYFSNTIPAGLFTLHLAHLSAQQRVSVNVRKLIARGFCSAGEPIDQIVRRNLAEVTDSNVRLYVSEIKRLHNTPEPDAAAAVVLGKGQIHLRPDGSVQFFGEAERFRLMEFLLSDGAYFKTALGHG